MKKQAKLVEQVLLSGASLDELIKMKMQEELKQAFKNKKQNLKKLKITEIVKAPKEKIFSKNAVYKVLNKITYEENYINGIQAEALIGLQNNVREKLKQGTIDVFATDNSYVKFEYVEVMV